MREALNRTEELAGSGVRLAEHLGRASKARVIDPLVKRLRKALARRFKLQASQYRQTGSIAGALTDKQRRAFRGAFKGAAASAYEGGVALAGGQLGVMIEEAATLNTLKQPPGWNRTAQDLEAEIDATTTDGIASILTGNQASSAAAALALINEKFQEWAADRSEMIAVNEISSAYHGGAMDVAEIVAQAGTQVEKAWDADPGACEVCLGNSGDGWVPEDILFSSGSDAPPQHPGCRCSLSLRKAE